MSGDATGSDAGRTRRRGRGSGVVRACMGAGLALVVFSMIGPVGASGDRLDAGPDPSAREVVGQERSDRMALFLAWFEGRILDEPYSSTTERLLEACGSYRAECFKEHHEPVEVVVDTLRAQPEAAAEAVAVLVARLVVRESTGTLTYGLVARPADGGPDRRLRWVEHLGYGTGFVVREWTEHGWVRLPASSGSRDGWVSTESGGLRGLVEGPSERAWRFDALEARRAATGEAARVEPGSYWILEVEVGRVRFRPEIPSDMPCSRRVPPDPPDPPVYEASVAAFFGPDGRPKLERAYPRGC